MKTMNLTELSRTNLKKVWRQIIVTLIMLLVSFTGIIASFMLLIYDLTIVPILLFILSIIPYLFFVSCYVYSNRQFRSYWQQFSTKEGVKVTLLSDTSHICTAYVRKSKKTGRYIKVLDGDICKTYSCKEFLKKFDF